MRSTILAAITTTTFALAACGGQEPVPQAPPPPAPPPATASATEPPVDTSPPPPPKPSLAELIPQTMKGIDEAFNAHDAKKLATFYTDDCVASAYGEPEAHGRDDISRGMDALFTTFNDAKSAPARGWAKGNVVVSEMVWTGTMTGDFMGMKATKKPVGQIRVHVIWFNDDGLVREMHEYGDDAGLMAQMTGKKGAPPIPVLPTNAPELHIAKGTPDEDKLADWAKGMDEISSKDDPKAVLAGTADDADYWINFTGAPAIRGKRDLGKDLDGFFKAFPDQKWTSVNAWGIDGFGIIEHTMTGTQKGRLGPLPASNKEVDGWHWIDIIQPTAEGKLQHGWGFANLVEMMQQTGALRQPSEKVGAPKPANAAPKPPGATPAKN
jgi:hypothetical protein